MPKPYLGVGIDAFVVHVSVAGSYISLVDRGVTVLDPIIRKRAPPIAYTLLFTTATPRLSLGVGIGAFSDHEFVGGGAITVSVVWFVFGR